MTLSHVTGEDNGEKMVVVSWRTRSSGPSRLAVRERRRGGETPIAAPRGGSGLQWASGWRDLQLYSQRPRDQRHLSNRSGRQRPRLFSHSSVPPSWEVILPRRWSAQARS